MTGGEIRLGWREWVRLPAIGIGAIKAKVDTGARTSAVHAFWIEPYRARGVQRIRFGVHPLQRDTRRRVVCDAEVSDRRRVRDSGGHAEQRWVIRTEVALAQRAAICEVTLTNRDNMLFRMLLGRSTIKALGGIVDPRRSYLAGVAAPAAGARS